MSFTSVIGFFGLGVLYDERQLERRPELRARIAELDSPEWLKEQCRRIERGRLMALTRLQEQAARRAAAAAADLAYSPSCFPMISFMISSVPPPIGPRRASRSARSTSYSRM